MRGIFLFRQSEVDWLYKYGASELYPEGWDDFVGLIPEGERGDLVEAYHRRLTSEDPAVRLAAAKAWSTWEGLTVTLLPDAEMLEEFTEDSTPSPIARIENHYMRNLGWLEEGQLLANAGQAEAAFPGVIVQGRHDCCTPPSAAWDLKKAWPEVELQIVPDGGHLFTEPGITDGLVRATDRFAGKRLEVGQRLLGLAPAGEQLRAGALEQFVGIADGEGVGAVNPSSSSQSIGAATGAPSRARAE